MKEWRNTQKAFTVVITMLFASSFSQTPTSGDIYYNEISSFPLGWSMDTNLTPPASVNSKPSIAISGGNIHLFYCNGSDGETYYARSLNAGEIWDKNGIFTPNDIPSSLFPKAASSGSDIHVVWQDTRLQWPTPEVFYKHSGDNGDNWDIEFNLSFNDNKMSQNPSIACSDQNVHVVWEDYRSGNEYNIYYKMSNDSGVTWQDGLNNVGQDRQLTFLTVPSSGNSPYIAADEYGVHVIYSMWTTDFGRWETMYINSSDNGITWSSPVMLSTHDIWHSDGRGIVADNNKVHVIYAEGQYGNDEIAYRNSTDNGATWNPEVRLTNDPNHSQQGDIAINASHVFVTWMDDRDYYDWTGSTSGAFELYYKDSFDGGATWGPDTRLTYAVNNSIQPCVAMDVDYIHVAWTDNRTDGDMEQIFYKRYPDFPDIDPPTHSNEIPIPDSYKDAPGTNVSVHVTDPSGVNESTIQLYVNGSLVSHTLTPITDGFNVSYESPGFEPGVITCRIVADDNLSNHLDYTWNFTILATYVIPLREGWNLISVPFEQVDTSISEVLKDISGKWDCIMAYNSTDPDHWKTNMTYRLDQLNDLKTLNHKMGFWINVTEPNVNLTVRGNISTVTTIPLYAGWNLVGYPTQTQETVGNALFGTTADRVEVFDPTDPYRTKEVTSTYIMKPGEGYWVHVVADSTWTILW